QIGLIPTTAQTLTFKGYFESSDGLNSLVVAVGGQSLSIVPLQVGSPFTLYGVDVRAFSGQTNELSFTVMAQRPHVYDNTLFLDSIAFSSQPIPEPGAGSLIAVGVAIGGLRRRAKPRRRRSEGTAAEGQQPSR